MRNLSELALLVAIASVFIMTVQGKAAEKPVDEAAGRAYITNLDKSTGEWKHRDNLASWNYETNLTDYNENIQLKTSLEVAKLEKDALKETITYPWKEYKDPTLRRMFSKYSELGINALPDDKNERLMSLVNAMTETYSTATICDYKNRTKCDLELSDAKEILEKTDDPEEMKYVLLEWLNKAGGPSRSNYTEYVKLDNEVAKLNGFKDTAEWWLHAYETSDMEEQLLNLWNQIKPLYLQLHAYYRRKLREKYGEHQVPAKGPIPIHLIGHVWGASWGKREEISKPYPKKAAIDVTSALIAQKYTPVKLFKTAEEFFVSINMTAMPDSFWKRSIFEKPKDRDIVCQASAWEFYDGHDFRIKACTKINSGYWETAHHELGHCFYFKEYAQQPIVFREGANEGFHEAVGDTIALSVTTPKHLRRIGLLEEGVEDEETQINQLYHMSLDKIAYLPFAYFLDVYRYAIFRGITSDKDYNCNFWALREAVQGLAPPGPRNEDGFDAGSIYHISADIDFTRYYISYIIQFQFHRSLCQIAGEYVSGDANKLLSNCDIYKNTDAGNAFRKMLSLGASKPWPDAMEVLTGQRNMDASGVLEYFKPLYDWVKAENEKNNEFIGWESNTADFCTAEQRKRMEESGFDDILAKF